MQTHSAFKLYACKRCGKSFALKAYLNKHHESACVREDGDDINNNEHGMSTDQCGQQTIGGGGGDFGPNGVDEMDIDDVEIDVENDENCTQSSTNTVWSI